MVVREENGVKRFGKRGDGFWESLKREKRDGKVMEEERVKRVFLVAIAIDEGFVKRFGFVWGFGVRRRR